jgi:hypothetical protein
MSVDCLDIGTVQAFLDGELTPEWSASVSGHIAACDACAVMLSEAEEESGFVFPALEREMNTLVPTQRLWTRINDSITVEKQNTPFWKKVWAGIAVALRNPAMTVAATVLIVFGVFTAIYRFPSNKIVVVDERLSATNQRQTPPAVSSSTTFTATGDQQDGPGLVSVPKSRNPEIEKPAVIQADYRVRPNSNNVVRNPKGPDSLNQDGYLPGEESYVKTIAKLSDSVAGQKDSVLKPSQQVAYERDLAVVDDSIKRMRKAVRNNPKNDSAKQVLYSSYQNKIDLLNSVAQREELVAGLNK